MTWRGVPWAVGTTVPAARNLAYYAGRGDEGVASPGECAVVASAVPDGNVTIRPGVAGILARYAGGAGQGYVVHNTPDVAETVAITPTAAGVTRSDLVAVIVEDDAFAGQPAPADRALGPYVRTVVYQGVPANTTRLDQVDPDQAGLALALVTLPPSTVNVDQAKITDLRKLRAARSRRETRLLSLGAVADVNLTAAAYTRFPALAGWTIPVPWWAVKAILEVQATGVRVSNDADAAGTWDGRARVKIGTVFGDETQLYPPPPAANSVNAFAFVAGGTVTIPSAMRGTDQTLEVQAYRVANTSGMQLSEGRATSVLASVTFLEDVSLDTFTV